MEMELNVTVVANDGRSVRMTAKQAQTIEALNNTRKGGCSSVTGYIPSTGWIKSPVENIQMITHISMTSLYKRRLAALEAIEYGDISRAAASDPVLREQKVSELLVHFDAKKAKMMETLQRGLDKSTVKNAHQEAHDRCYAYFNDVKVHLVTEKINGRMEPVDNSGSFTLKSIMVPYLELNKCVVVEGERKVVNSGVPVRVGNLIERCLNKRSVVLKTLSLKEDNFESFHSSGKEILPEDVARLGDVIES